jgi:hypothetical protein
MPSLNLSQVRVLPPFIFGALALSIRLLCSRI